MSPTHDPFTGQRLQPDPNDPRMGVPPDKMGAFFLPLKEDKRQGVMVVVFPPEELRDAPYEVVEAFVLSRGQNMLRSIAQEIHRGFTSEPPSLADLQTQVEHLQRYVDANRKKG